MLNANQCLSIIELFKNGIYIDNSITKQWKYLIDEEWVYDWVASHYEKYELVGKIIGFKYQVGDYLDWHMDNQYNTNIAMTGGIVLNSDYEGGLFEFDDGSILDQTPGKSFEMSRNILHRVTEVTKGTRYSLHYKLNFKNKNSLI
jgi:hypothetical protein